MSNFLLFKKDLLSIMGDDARKDFTILGLETSPDYQFLEATHTIAKITDRERASKYIINEKCEELNLSEANAKIDELYTPTYSIYNESLMNANLTQKISQGTINLDEMLPEWTAQQEAEWLYSNGISGIRKSVKPPYFVE